MTARTKQTLWAAGSVLAIAWSIRSVLSYVSEPEVSGPLHEGVGRVIGEQTAALVGHGGQIAVITIDAAQFPALTAQWRGFKKALREHEVRIADTVVIDTKGDGKYGPGHGLSAKKFMDIRKHHDKVSALVSFVGVPNLTDEQVHKCHKSGPKLVAEAKWGERLQKLLDDQVVKVAIVPRFLFPAPHSKPSHTAQDPFDLYFQIVKAPDAPAATQTNTVSLSAQK